MTYLEHANLTVPDIDAGIAFLKVIDPDMRVLQDAVSEAGERWAHVAIGDSYIALQEPHVGETPGPRINSYVDIGVNHLAWVVEDLDTVVARLEEGGYRRGIPGEEHEARRRVYYYDHAGIEWEIVQYLTEDRGERFSY
ncbi:MAG: VOC family protein [Planctomycetota bacterium]|jgi:catechol 2,3-dioxygenase-like lactoylglutathione lyase family enzyme